MLIELFDKLPVIKSALRELFYRPSWYSDRHHEFERLFQWTKDPWNFERSRFEQERMQSLFETIKTLPHETILEVGCAEGLFTAQLETIARQVVAIDVSATALSRAKQRCPGVMFWQKSLHDFRWHEHFNIVEYLLHR